MRQGQDLGFESPPAIRWCIWASGVSRRGNCFRQILGRMASHTGQYCQVAGRQIWSRVLGAGPGVILFYFYFYFGIPGTGIEASASGGGLDRVRVPVLGVCCAVLRARWGGFWGRSLTRFDKRRITMQ
jgi:hypothetical protein